MLFNNLIDNYTIKLEEKVIILILIKSLNKLIFIIKN